MAWVCNYEAKNTNNSRATPDPPSRAGDASVVGRRGLLTRLTNYTKFHISWIKWKLLSDYLTLCIVCLQCWGACRWSDCEVWRAWGLRVQCCMEYSRRLGVCLSQLRWKNCNQPCSTARKVRHSHLIILYYCWWHVCEILYELIALYCHEYHL